MSNTLVSKLSAFDILVKIIPGSGFLISLYIIHPSNVQSLNDDLNVLLVLVGSIPITYIFGLVLQDASSLCFPRTKHFQEWMRKARNNLNIEESGDRLVVSGGDHVRAIVLADAVVRFNLDKKLLKPSDSEYSLKPIRRSKLFLLTCFVPLYIISLIGLKNERDEEKRVYYGGENQVFSILREHSIRNEYDDFLRFQRLYVLHRTLTLVSCISSSLFFISALIVLGDVYTATVSGFSLLILCVFSLALTTTLYNGTLKYEKIRDERLLNRYYEDKSGDLLVIPKYAT